MNKKDMNISPVNAVKDDLVTEQIKSILDARMEASAMDINVTTRNGVVELSGLVDVLAEKKYAGAVARSIDGVRKVENNITISMDSNITDKHIEKEVINRLNQTGDDSNLTSVGVKVNDGVVNLIGHVDTLKTAHTAMNLASQIRGVKDVVNNTNILNAEEYDDVSLHNRVRDQISASNLSSKDIDIEVKNNRVTLKGYVNNRRESELAKELTMGIEGVKKVHNRLRVRK
ncbi:BON domain-containing protein [Caldisalinibacter kiritimatiensis]|uniref:Transport-associated protein n=1 Tax=Caldisalinibacter kiritimatiensis TaxID=1304284 RepID=R1CRR0_9FIRM|nr:BON domain-containing protein [Caldisalinibacter kiritimatiensis]EOD01361.1 Transport-associated protein [Caldisalinibacter kiritimatiensis]